MEKNTNQMQIGPERFEPIKHLGKGYQAEGVVLVKDKVDGKLYAMKIFNNDNKEKVRKDALKEIHAL